jgi:membrane-bound serine protease (ClpP class)
MGLSGLPRRSRIRWVRQEPRRRQGARSRRSPPAGTVGPTALTPGRCRPRRAGGEAGGVGAAGGTPLRTVGRHRRAVTVLLGTAGFALLLLGAAAQAPPTGATTAGELTTWVATADAHQSRQAGDPPQVLVTTVDGTITPVVANYLGDVISRGENNNYDAVVIQLDTPGGLETSMRDIIQRILAAEVPVIVYVAPEGARAASAGALITFSAHVAAMAPATAIGAATPVDLAGDDDLSDSDRKAINDAAELAISVAERRDRNTEFAEDTVREGRSASASEAAELGAVDLVAPSLADLLDEVDGWTVAVAPDDTPVELRTADPDITTMDMGLFRQIQQLLADPNLAFIFLSLGTLGIIYEFANPGVTGAGIFGAVLLILAMFALAVLPVNAVGLLLLGIAAALFIAELFAPGVGVAAAGGTAALLFSGIFLFEDTPGMGVSLWVVAPVALVVGGAVLIAGRLVMRTHKRPSTTTGTGLFLGRTVTVTDVAPDGHKGLTFVEGAWWQVRSDSRALDEDGAARVVRVDGLTLVVEPAEMGGTGTPGPTGAAEGPDAHQTETR